MKNSNKILGSIFVAIALVNLFRLEWIDFGIFAAIGSVLLLEANNSATKKALQILATLTAIVLLIVRVVTDFNS